MATGWSLDYVRQLDVLTFNALMDRITKVTYRERTEAAWVSVATANAGMSGKTNQVKKITDSWAVGIGDQVALEAGRAGKDANAFLRDFNLAGGGKL